MAEAPRTEFASAALRLGGMFQAHFHQTRLGAETPKGVRIMEPEGPSTAGGKQSRQSIVLVPESGEGASVVCGWVDVAARAAELRSYESLGRHFQARWGMPVDVPREAYESFLAEVQAFLQSQGITATLAQGGPVADPPADAPVRPSGNLKLFVVFGALAVLALGAGAAVALLGR